MYYLHLLQWLSVFPRAQMLFLRFEDLVTNATETMNKVWSFLNVTAAEVTTIDHRVNANSWVTSEKYSTHFQMWSFSRDTLTEFFYPFNSMLADLLHDVSYLWAR